MSLALFDPVDPQRQQTVDAVAIELRERLPWLWTKGFRIANTEGYMPGVFGSRAGTRENINAYNVLHEVSHAIELVKSDPDGWKKRLNKDDYGMRIKSYQTVAGQRYYEPQTMQATERECRVGAIQLHLLQAGGYEHGDFKTDFVTTLKYMADWYFGGDNILNTPDPEKYTAGQKKWVATRMKLLEKEYKKYSELSIQNVWTEVSEQLAKKKLPVFHFDAQVVTSQTIGAAPVASELSM